MRIDVELSDQKFDSACGRPTITLQLDKFDPPNPPLTDALITAAESELGVRLPASYISLLRDQNGGYVSEKLVQVASPSIPLPLQPFLSDGYVSIGSIAGIGNGSGGHGDIRTTRYFVNEWDLPERLVLIDGDGHEWIAFDYRNHDGPEPPVILIESDSCVSIQVAASFSALISACVEFEDVYDENGDLRM